MSEGRMLLVDDLYEGEQAVRPGSVWRFPKEGVELDLAEIVAAGERHAAAFAALGARAGDRIGLALENCPEYTSMLLGVWRLGAVAVPLRPSGGARYDMGRFLSEIDRDCEFAVLVVEERLDPAVQATLAARGRRVVVRQELLGHAGERASPARLRPEDLAIIQYSSGSTAHPKGVMVTHGMVRDQVRQLDAEYRLGCGGSSIRSSGSWLPLHHDMGLFIGILLPLFARAHNVLGTPPYYMRDPKRWFALQSTHAVDWNFTTNLAMASSLGPLRRLDPSTTDLSRFHIYLAAEKVSPVVLRKTQEALERFGVPHDHVRVGYGMAENTLGVASTKDGPVRCLRVRIDAESGVVRLEQGDGSDIVEIVSIGRPHVNTTVTVRDEQNRSLPDLRLGEICVEGPCVTDGYFRNPEESAKQLTGRMLRTRDIGFRYEGELYFVSRKDDMLVVGGRNIAPDDVEDCVEASGEAPPGGAVLIDVEIPTTGKTELVLLVEAAGEISPDVAAARRAALQSRILVERGVFVNQVAFAKKNSLEKTSSGKKRRRVIRQRFLEKELELHGLTSKTR